MEDINAQGGVLGRPLELIIFDIEDMMAEKLIAAADYLVIREQVDAVIAGYAGMGPDVPAFGKYDVPFLHNDAVKVTVDLVKDNYDEYWNVFQQCPWEEPYGREHVVATLSYPFEFPNNKLAIIALEFEWDLGFAESFREYAEKEGWDVVMYEIFPLGTSEWGPLLAEIRAEDPALIFFSSQDITSGVTFLNQFLENPTNSLIDFACTLWWSGFLETMGEGANGIVGWFGQEPLPAPDDPEGDLLKERYEARFGIPPAGAWVCSYDTIGTWAAAVERVGDVSDYRAICQAIIDYPYEGKWGKYEFRLDLGNAAMFGPDMPNFYVQIQDGHFVRLLATGDTDYDLGIYEVVPYNEKYPWTAPTEFQTPPWIK